MSTKKEEKTVSLIIPQKDIDKNFLVVVDQATKLRDDCKKLEIKDDITCNIALAVAKSANDLDKNVDVVRLALKKPYFDTATAIDKAAKKITDITKEAVAIAKDKIKTFQDQKKKEAEEELKKLQDQKKENEKNAEDRKIILTQIRLHLSQMYKKFFEGMEASGNDISKIQVHTKELLKKFHKPEDYLHYVNDIKEFRKFMIACADAKMKLIGDEDQEHKKLYDINQKNFNKFQQGLIGRINDDLKGIEEEAEAKSTEATSQMIFVASGAESSNSRVKWDWEVLDISKVPAEYLQINDKLVREKIIELSKNEDLVLDGNTEQIPGIKIIKDSTIVLR